MTRKVRLRFSFGPRVPSFQARTVALSAGAPSGEESSAAGVERTTLADRDRDALTRTWWALAEELFSATMR